MNIAILGAGALGSLWYAKLFLAGNSVSFIPDLRLSANKENPHSLQFNDGNHTHPLAIHITPLAQLQQPIDLLLVTLKAYQIKPALRQLKPYLSPNQLICLMHNGMGVSDEIKQLLQDNPLLLATTTQAALRVGDKQIRHTGAGETFIGPVEPLNNMVLPQIITELNGALPTVHWVDNIEPMLLKKLAINCVINPLTAIYQCKNGELNAPQYQRQLDILCKELAEVFSAHGYPTQKTALETDIKEVIKATALNYSSMNRDRYHKRQSEINAITGYLISLAKLYQIDVPENQSLFNTIKQIESRY